MSSPSPRTQPGPKGGGRATPRFEVTLDGLRQLRQRIDHKQLEPNDWPLVGALVSKQIARAEATLDRMLAKLAPDVGADGAQTSAPGAGEPPDAGGSPSPGTPEAPANGDSDPAGSAGAGSSVAAKKPTKGHGRNGASAYRTAQHVLHALALGVIGALCSACGVGTMWRHREKIVIRILGQPLFAAEAHHYEQARCRKCDRIVRADGPPHVHQGIGTDYVRYDDSAAAMLMVMHYFAGAPFKRLEALHAGWGVPFSDANQWRLVSEADDRLLPLYKALEQHAIQKATNFRIDDTGSKVIALQKQIAAEISALEALGEPTKDVRTGINATGIYWETPNGAIILFYTGRHHAGEIIDQLLRHRRPASPQLVKCSDGASKNFDHAHADQLLEATCNAHALLKFRAIKDKYPAEYAAAGTVYKKVFDNDDEAKARGLSPIDRMLHHRQHSKPLMLKLKKMCQEKLASRTVEPNSPLWEPLTFVINQWERLTLFCDVVNVPLDTNLIEQALIMPVRYLAGSFNYHTQDGAVVGDRLMSLIATARARGVEPVTYLNECLRCHEDLANRPEYYLPWVYRERLAQDKDTGPPQRLPRRGNRSSSSAVVVSCGRHSPHAVAAAA